MHVQNTYKSDDNNNSDWDRGPTVNETENIHPIQKKNSIIVRNEFKRAYGREKSNSMNETFVPNETKKKYTIYSCRFIVGVAFADDLFQMLIIIICIIFC